ncbi:hypothetical protein BSPWISOXPB_4440 [uncultured Gammaproteobacteria bacterium]|nr:hypothetical protein BSPWISOXPB_4440 [uncultured Gammaproteobacteria bacterium]
MNKILITLTFSVIGGANADILDYDLYILDSKYVESYSRKKSMIKILTGLLNPVANADPFTYWEWVEEHPDIGVPALFIDAPMMVFISSRP